MIKATAKGEFEVYVLGIDGRPSRKGTLKDGVFTMDVNPRKDYFRALEGKGKPTKLGLDEEIYQDLKRTGSCVSIVRNDKEAKINWQIPFAEFAERSELYSTTRFRPHRFVYLEYWHKIADQGMLFG